MNKKRIVAFGDSQTYGYFLIKDNKGYGLGPSSKAWPHLIGNAYNIDVVNNGVCGASNKEIWLEAINFEYNEDDLVCVLWSFFDRDFFPTGELRDSIIGFKGHYKGTQLIPNHIDTQKNKIYYKELHTDYNSLMSFGLYKTHLAYYLNSLGIPYVFKNLALPRIPVSSFEWDKVQCDSINYILDDYAFDNVHYGPKSHSIVAEKFIEDINEKNYR